LAGGGEAKDSTLAPKPAPAAKPEPASASVDARGANFGDDFGDDLEDSAFANLNASVTMRDVLVRRGDGGGSDDDDDADDDPGRETLDITNAQPALTGGHSLLGLDHLLSGDLSSTRTVPSGIRSETGGSVGGERQFGRQGRQESLSSMTSERAL
jgi:hypothetical protein